MTLTTDDPLPQDLLDSTIELLADLAAISSPSGDPAGLWRMAERLAAELRRRGLAAEVRAGLAEEDEAAPPSDAGSGTGGGYPLAGDRPDGEPRLPVLTARPTHGAPAGRHLLLIGHFDTVLPAAPPRHEDGRLVATGAIDMKGGLAAFLGALDLLALRGRQPPDDLLLVAVPDEEVAGTLSRAALRRWGPQARGLWVLEPGEPGNEPAAETVVGGRRGMFGWRLEVQGRAAHSGLHYAAGRSALLAAARWCLGAPEAAAASAAVASAAVAPAPGAPADGAGMGGGRRGTGAPTVNSGRLVAGDATFVDGLAGSHGWLGTDRQLNVVPDRAVVEGEARFLRTSEGENLGQRLQALAAAIATATATQLSWTRGAIIPPVEPHPDQIAYCARAVDLAAHRGWPLEIEQERGGLSFPNFLPPGLPRIPTLDGLGPIGGGMHTRDEWIDLRSLGRRVVLLADLLEDDQRRGGSF